MRVLVLLPLLLLVPVADLDADQVVTTSGRIVDGVITTVEITPDGSIGERFDRSDLASVRLDGDRRLLDLLWLTRTQRFALDRETKPDETVGVYIGLGAFPPSALAVVRRLDAAGTPPRLLFARDFRAKSLRKLDRLVVPGGWAPSMIEALGEDGLGALRAWVRQGGRYLGICAGAYLACRRVTWQGEVHPYPLDLVDAVAVGPLEEIAPWPASAGFDLVFEGEDVHPALYAGGCRFDAAAADVLARYPNGTPACIRAKAGKGRVVLTGAHVELDAKTDRDLLDQDAWAARVKGLTTRAFDRLWKQMGD